MKHRLLSGLELYLGTQFDAIFMPPLDLIDRQSEDAAGEFEKYLSSMSEHDISKVYGNLYEVFCHPNSKKIRYVSIFNDSNNSFLRQLCDKPLPELSNPDTLREVFITIFQIDKRELKRQSDEEKALGQLPAYVKSLWNDPSFSENAVFIRSENSLSMVVDFAWGRAGFEFINAECDPPIKVEQALKLEHRELYPLRDGFGFSFRCFVEYDEEAGLGTTSDVEYEITFSGVEHLQRLYNYFDYCAVDVFLEGVVNLQLASALSNELVNKHRCLGDYALNELERRFFPAAQVIRHLSSSHHIIRHLNRYHRFEWVKRLIENVTASPEQLREWAQRLQTEGRDRYLHKFFSAVAECKDDMTDHNIKKALRKMKAIYIELSVFESRYVLHWIVSFFKKACAQYDPKPAIGRFHESATCELRSFVAERLRKDGFSGTYPHFRKVSPVGTGQLISFAEFTDSEPGRLATIMAAGTVALDKDLSVQGIPFDELTAYDYGVTHWGKNKSRYHVVCNMANPAYEVNSLASGSEGAKTPEIAKAGFEDHLEQAYRVLSGQRMTKEYKARYGIGSYSRKQSWGFAMICLIAGLAWSTAFWLLFPIGHESYLSVLLQPFFIFLCYAGGLFFAFFFWLLAFPVKKATSP